MCGAEIHVPAVCLGRHATYKAIYLYGSAYCVRTMPCYLSDSTLRGPLTTEIGSSAMPSMAKITTTAVLLLLMSLADCNGIQMNQSSLIDEQCSPGFVYSTTLNNCECNPDINVKCDEDDAVLSFATCMTYDEDEGTFIGVCISFRVHGRNVSDRVYIELPENVTELNEYMCGVMNRRGIACSECIEGFSPAITSFGFQCSNCTDVWYGVPLFLLLEFVPSTIFYLIVVSFGLSVTSAP